MSAVFDRLKWHLGWFNKESEPCVVVFAEAVSGFDEVAELIAELKRDGGRLNVCLLSRQAGVWQGQEVLALPVGVKSSMALLLTRLKVRCVVALNDLPSALVRA